MRPSNMKIAALPAMSNGASALTSIAPRRISVPGPASRPQPSLRDGDYMRLDLAIHRLAAEPVRDRFRGQGGCLRQPRGIPCLDLVSQRGPLAIRDGGVLARHRAPAGCPGGHGQRSCKATWQEI